MSNETYFTCKIIFFRLEAIILRTFFERRSIVIFPDFEHVFAHWIGHIGFNFRTPWKKRVSRVLIFAHPSCAKIVGFIFAHLFCAKITVTRNLGKVRYGQHPLIRTPKGTKDLFELPNVRINERIIQEFLIKGN